MAVVTRASGNIYGRDFLDALPSEIKAGASVQAKSLGAAALWFALYRQGHFTMEALLKQVRMAAADESDEYRQRLIGYVFEAASEAAVETWTTRPPSNELHFLIVSLVKDLIAKGRRTSDDAGDAGEAFSEVAEMLGLAGIKKKGFSASAVRKAYYEHKGDFPAGFFDLPAGFAVEHSNLLPASWVADSLNRKR